MTREDAIFTIEHRDSIMDYGETEQLSEALDMALEALKEQAAHEKLWEEIDQAGYEGREVEIRYCGRLFKVREVAQ